MFKNIKAWFIFQFNTWWNTYHFWSKKREAERLHKLTGKQYFIVPKTKTSLMVVDNTFIKYYNKNAPKGKRITHPDLLKMCYYKTSCGNYKRSA